MFIFIANTKRRLGQSSASEDETLDKNALSIHKINYVILFNYRANIKRRLVRPLIEDEQIDEKMTQMFQRVIGIISKPQQQRRRTDIEQLLPWLRKRSELLENAEVGR